jgi:hypothetical protein
VSRITDIEDGEVRRLAIIEELYSLNQKTTDELVEQTAQINKERNELELGCNLRSWIINTRMNGDKITRQLIEKVLCPPQISAGSKLLAEIFGGLRSESPFKKEH